MDQSFGQQFEFDSLSFADMQQQAQQQQVSPNLQQQLQQQAQQQAQQLQNGMKSGPPPGQTVSVTGTTRMRTYGVANVPQQTRHARRIYVGGVPPNYIDEDGLRDFFNAVIAQGLGEENDYSYVLSVYVDQKKCFSFVELKSIELASACLALDGIVMKNIVLRILRANEYKPELIPPSMNKLIHLDLSGFQFGVPSNPSSSQDNHELMNERALDSIIQYNNLNVLETGSVIIVGYPYDESTSSGLRRSSSTSSSRSGVGGQMMTSGVAQAPKIMRNSIRKYKFGVVENAEYGVDLSNLKILDIGDVIAGKASDETKVNLVTTVSELVVRGGIPFIIGGTNELIYSSVSGLMTVAGGNVASVNVSARLNTRLLDDSRFCPLRSATATYPTCEGRFVLFGAQGSQCSKDEAKFIENRGGKICWLAKDIRRQHSKSVTDIFQETLKEMSMRHQDTEGAAADTAIPVVVSFDAGALCSYISPAMTGSNSGAMGFYYEEFIEMARLAGADPNVAMINITEFSPLMDESRPNLMMAELLYHFLLGVASRQADVAANNTLQAVQQMEGNKFSLSSDLYMRGPFNCATQLVDPLSSDSVANNSLHSLTNGNSSSSHSLMTASRDGRYSSLDSMSLDGFSNSSSIQSMVPPPTPVNGVSMASQIAKDRMQQQYQQQQVMMNSNMHMQQNANDVSNLRQSLSQLAMKNNYAQQQQQAQQVQQIQQMQMQQQQQLQMQQQKLYGVSTNVTPRNSMMGMSSMSNSNSMMMTPPPSNMMPTQQRAPQPNSSSVSGSGSGSALSSPAVSSNSLNNDPRLLSRSSSSSFYSTSSVGGGSVGSGSAQRALVPLASGGAGSFYNSPGGAPNAVGSGRPSSGYGLTRAESVYENNVHAFDETFDLGLTYDPNTVNNGSSLGSASGPITTMPFGANGMVMETNGYYIAAPPQLPQPSPYMRGNDGMSGGLDYSQQQHDYR